MIADSDIGFLESFITNVAFLSLLKAFIINFWHFQGFVGPRFDYLTAIFDLA